MYSFSLLVIRSLSVAAWVMVSMGEGSAVVNDWCFQMLGLVHMVAFLFKLAIGWSGDLCMVYHASCLKAAGIDIRCPDQLQNGWKVRPHEMLGATKQLDWQIQVWGFALGTVCVCFFSVRWQGVMLKKAEQWFVAIVFLQSSAIRSTRSNNTRLSQYYCSFSAAQFLCAPRLLFLRQQDAACRGKTRATKTARENEENGCWKMEKGVWKVLKAERKVDRAEK